MWLSNISCVRIDPDDVLCVFVPQQLSMERRKDLVEQLENCPAFDGHEIAIFDSGVTLGVVKWKETQSVPPEDQETL